MNLFRIKIPYTLTKYVKLVGFSGATRPYSRLLRIVKTRKTGRCVRPFKPLYRSFAALFAKGELVKDSVNKASPMFINVSLSAK
jgi:hypothetical protein